MKKPKVLDLVEDGYQIIEFVSDADVPDSLFLVVASDKENTNISIRSTEDVHADISLNRDSVFDLIRFLQSCL